jgi:uncharacterized protein with FMN-binding domain
MRGMIKRSSLSLVVPALATVLTACGGSSSQPPPSPGPTTSTAGGPAASGSTPTTSTAATAPTAGGAARTVAGSLVDDQFGSNQVTIVVQGSKIKDVTYALPTDRPRSAFINSQAGPLLRSEVLQAQSANVNIISGATYTSEAFIQSLQAAVSSAHLAQG